MGKLKKEKKNRAFETEMTLLLQDSRQFSDPVYQ